MVKYNWLSSTVSTIVGLLLIISTAYDLKIARDVRRRKQRAANITANSNGRTDLKLNLNGLDDINEANG